MKYKQLLWLLLLALILMGATHYGPKVDRRPRYALDVFGKKIAKEYQLEFLNSGLGHLADAKEGIWALNLVSRQKMTLEEGRCLAQKVAERLVEKIFTDPLFADYCKEAPRFTLDKKLVAFRLAFWDEKNDRPCYPYLAQIRLADGKLYYHYADPQTQALQEPIVFALK